MQDVLVSDTILFATNFKLFSYQILEAKWFLWTPKFDLFATNYW